MRIYEISKETELDEHAVAMKGNFEYNKSFIE
jgi:hypothetical protein